MRARLKHLPVIAALLVCGLAAGTADADVVVVVSAESPVVVLTRAQLTDIYLGRLNRFPDGSPAVPIDQSERSLAHNAFYSGYLGRSAAQIKAHWSRLVFTGRGQPPRSVGNSDAVAEIVAANPSAIGYVDAEAVNENLRVVRID